MSNLTFKKIIEGKNSAMSKSTELTDATEMCGSLRLHSSFYDVTNKIFSASATYGSSLMSNICAMAELEDYDVQTTMKPGFSNF